MLVAKSIFLTQNCRGRALRGSPFTDGFNPAFARCCFCIAASRLTEVWSNGVKVVENRYDALGRRVIKRTPDATHTFVYDGWLLVVERVELGNGQLDQIDYWWGKDISGTLDGAGGIGGLLYLVKNGRDVYVPLYDGHHGDSV